MTLRGLIIGVALSLWVTALGQAVAAPKPVPVLDAPRSLGNPRAHVVVTEYASLGCPHCALWARTEFPAFKAKYVDTGKVRFQIREMLNGNAALAAAGWLTARCATPDKYFQVTEAVFAAQDEISGGGGETTLARIAKDAGVPQARLDACLRDENALKALRARSEQAYKIDGVSGTPAFSVSAPPAPAGTRLEGYQTLAQLDAAIAAVTPKVRPRPVTRRRHHAH